MPAGFIRRSAALIYDTMILAAIFLLVTAIALWLNGGTQVPAAWLRSLFLLTTYAFYCWFWLHGGQTLGMRAWRLRLVDANDRSPTLRAVSVRFIAAIASWLACGLGHLWILFDARKRAWHDSISHTYVVVDDAHRRQP